MTRCDEPLLDKSGSDGLPEALGLPHLPDQALPPDQTRVPYRSHDAPNAGTPRALLPALAAAAECGGTQVRVGTFGDTNPEALVVMSDWLNTNKVANECWTFYRQPSGGLSIAKLDSGDLDMALLGSTPHAAAAARAASSRPSPWPI